MKEKAVMAYYETLLWNLSGGTEEDHKHVRRINTNRYE
jgi:hypothetical protein